MQDDESSTWFSFLEKECDGQEGLLCFYDVEKSHEAAYFGKLLAKALAAFFDESSSIEEVIGKSD